MSSISKEEFLASARPQFLADTASFLEQADFLLGTIENSDATTYEVIELMQIFQTIGENAEANEEANIASAARMTCSFLDRVLAEEAAFDDGIQTNLRQSISALREVCAAA
jgi:hypothetical protein